MATRKAPIYLLPITIAITLLLIFIFSKTKDGPSSFDGNRAYQDVLAQVAFGPRTPGSTALAQEQEYISTRLIEAGWQVSIQNSSWEGFSIKNIIAYKEDTKANPLILLGAHYDSRMIADQDPKNDQGNGVPGANDGASGVAVLLELARSLPGELTYVQMVFFDAEDNVDLEGRTSLMGSRAFVLELTSPPEAVVIVDMIGDADLEIYIEGNSDPQLVSEIWAQAQKLGHKQFVSEVKYSIIDDHIPFLAAGIPAVDIIDFDYPYWHTLADTPDKVSPASMQAVGETLWSWIVGKQ